MKDNKTCIICHKFCYKPDKYKRNQTPIRSSRYIKKIRNEEYILFKQDIFKIISCFPVAVLRLLPNSAGEGRNLL